MSKTVYMRGLQVFISDIRACQNREQEQRRVDKELAKIRSKFGDDKSLSGYDRRKYIWKLLYIYMLGYDINFGHKQACDLIPMPKYSDKQVGYMACSLLLHENDEFLRLAINAIHQDLTSRNEAFQCLALSFVGTISGAEMAEALTQDVIKLLTSGAARPIVKKRASLCLLRLIRKAPPEAQLVAPDTFGPVLNALLEERDLGLLLSAVTLLWGILQRSGITGYETCQSRVLRVLERLISSKDRVSSEYLYYGIPSPWLQTKCLRALQFYPAPEAPAERKLLLDILNAVINYTSSEASKNVNPNKANALNASLFEAIAVAIQVDLDRNLLGNCAAVMSRYLQGREPNAKYLALDYMAKLAAIPNVMSLVRSQQEVVVASLRDPDLTIRKKAMDLLFVMCDTRSSEAIVDELLKYLVISDFSLREELVVKIAILAEKFAPTVQWYVDSMLSLMERAGDFVSAEVWQRVVQLVTNRPEVQAYAARAVVASLRRGAVHESLVCAAAYIIGEYGKLVREDVSSTEQLRLLQGPFNNAAGPTKGILLTAILKIYLADPSNASLRADTMALFERAKKFIDADLQQRATEYLALANTPKAASQQFVLPMPKWELREESSLMRLLLKDHSVEPQLPNAPPSEAVETAAVTAQQQEPQEPPKPEAPPVEVDLLGMDDAPSPAPLAGGDLLSSAPVASSSAATPSTAVVPVASSSSAAVASTGGVDFLADLLGASVAITPPTPAPLQLSAPAPALPPGQFPPGGGMYGAPQPGVNAMYPYPGYVTQLTASSTVPLLQQSLTGAQQLPSYAPLPVPGAALVANNPFDALQPPAVQAAAGVAPGPEPGFLFPGMVAPSSLSLSPPQPTGSVEQWFYNLLLKDRGILYEDQYLQVGVQSRFADARGEVILFLGNKTDYTLTGIICQVSAGMSAGGLQIGPNAPPAQIAAKQQVQVPLSFACTGVFRDAPTIALGYGVTPGGAPLLSTELRLPVLPHRFLTPHPEIGKEFFFEQWKVHQTPPCKMQEMLERASPLSVDAVISVLRGAGLGVEHGYLDPSPHNEAGASYLVLGPAPEQRHLVQCRVEANPQNRSQFRLTVVSAQAPLAESLKDVLAYHIRAAPAS